MRTFRSLLLPALLLSAASAAATVADSDMVFAAIQYGDIASLRELLAENASNAGTTNASGMMPLHFAARVGRTDAAEALLDAGADPNAALAKSAGTPLHYAANVDAAEVVRLLRKLQEASFLRALEAHMLDEMGDAVLMRRFLHGAGAYPDADARGPELRKFLRDQPRAARQRFYQDHKSTL